MARLTRRAFVQLFGMGAGSAVLSTGVTACNGGGRGTFEHGVASGDPLTDRVIIWTRVTPPVGRSDREITVEWQVATDVLFEDIVVQDEGTTDASRDFTVKVDAAGLQPNTTYYYRFIVGRRESPIGTTKTLPEDDVDQVKLVVFSCSNYPAGRFHVYAEGAEVRDVDAFVHLGDYIYEYAREGYASEDAEALGRQVEPAKEILTLSDYRTRHAQYRTDEDLQALHAKAPMIAVWDDHEVTNDAWRNGAENHQEDEGDYGQRLMAALQAYAEWMPIRPMVEDDPAALQRNFRFGELVNLIMLDTRIVGRDQQIDFGAYITERNRVDLSLFDAINNPDRTLLGEDQRDWLLKQLTTDEATWQVLGQQVLMGIMELPSPVLPRDLSDPSSAPLTFDEYILLGTVALLSQRINADDPTVTDEERALVKKNQAFLAANLSWLLEPNVPYNLDAWDGYAAEREEILQAAVDSGVNLVVLAGDTHNAWANNLEITDEKDQPVAAGVEFATASVSSPGLEEFLGIATSDDPGAAAEAFEGGLPQLVTRLQYSNLLERGFMTVTFTAKDVTAEWTFVDTVKEDAYSVVTARGESITVAAGANAIS